MLVISTVISWKIVFLAVSDSCSLAFLPLLARRWIEYSHLVTRRWLAQREDYLGGEGQRDCSHDVTVGCLPPDFSLCKKNKTTNLFKPLFSKFLTLAGAYNSELIKVKLLGSREGDPLQTRIVMVSRINAIIRLIWNISNHHSTLCRPAMSINTFKSFWIIKFRSVIVYHYHILILWIYVFDERTFC